MRDEKLFSRTTRIDVLPHEERPDTHKLPRAGGATVTRPPAAPPHELSRDIRGFLDGTYDAALITDLSGSIHEGNVRAAEFLRCTRSELRGQTIDTVVSGWQTALLATVLRALENDRFVVLKAWCVRRDDRLFPAEIAVSRLELSGREFLCFFVRDITLRREAEERLRMGFAAIENAGDGIALADLDGRLQYANPAVARLWAVRDAEALRGCSLRDLLLDPAAVDAMLQAAAHRRTWTHELRAVRQDRTEFDIHVSAAPNVDSDDECIGLVLSLRDISARKESERRLHRTMDDLSRSNADLEEFAYVVSHDLQEPLRKVVQFGDMLKDRCGPSLPDDARDCLERMQSAARRMGELIRGILALSRISTRAGGHESVDLNATVREVIGDLDARIEETRGRVEVGLLPVVDAEPLQMRQLFQNLIGNALKYHKPDTPPAVRIAARFPVESASGGVAECEVKVADSGIGFDSSQAERIFGVFQRLHARREYEGTGIGLAICRKIVERHGGSLRAEGVPGEGACFTFRLPMTRTDGPGGGADSG